MAPLLEVSDLQVSFRTGGGLVRAVRGVSYELRAGEVLGIVGESGSGKSAGALALMGLLPPTAEVEGSVRLEGQELLGLGDRDLSKLRGERIAMVFQDPLSALTPVYTIGDQVAETIRVHRGLDKRAATERAIELLDVVGIPEARRRASAYPHEFSGGMRQRVMIAMAIANDPDIIVADEPTTALDVTIQAQVLEALRSAREATGAAMILITHDLSIVAGFADRVAVMYAGRLVERGTVDEVYYAPRMPYTMGLLGAIPRLDGSRADPLVPIEGTPPSLLDLPPECPFAPRCPLSIDRCWDEEPALRPVPTPGQPNHLGACHRMEHIEEEQLSPEDAFPIPAIAESLVERVPRDQRKPVLEVQDLERHFPLLKGAIFKREVGTVRAVDGISFEVREGEVLGLVGESGCGKTTTLLELLELRAPQAGRIVVLGRDTEGLGRGDRQALRADISVVFQDPLASLDPRQPVSDILAAPLRTHNYPKEEVAPRIRELLQLVGLSPEHASRYPQQFSGGQRQRVAIARALALEPSLLFLDEPVSALDVSIQAGVINLLDDLRGRLGLSYLFVAHDLAVVRHLADRIAVMYLGRIVEEGDVDPVYGAPAHPYTQALLSAIPLPDPRRERARRRIVLEGDLPSPADPPSGCRFRTRCQKFANDLTDAERERCIAQHPPLDPVGDDHRAACHYAERVDVI